MGRYCYSREIETIEGKEVFAVIEYASFDEAKKEVDKGIRDRRLELADKHFDVHIPAQPEPAAVESKGNASLNPPASDAPADLPDSPDQLPTGKEGEGAGGAS